MTAATGYVPPAYCRIRHHEFLLQRMLLPDVFGQHYDQLLGDADDGWRFRAISR
jgi:hypothetical protein